MKRIHTFDRAEYDENINNALWRLENLYVIIDKNQKRVLFKLNDAQKLLLRDLHPRNIIPKARQLGMSTCIQLLMLDSCLFTPNFRGKVVAQNLEVSSAIFEDKFKYAYDQLPEFIKLQKIIVRSTTTMMSLENGSSVTVSTTARGATPNMLHISEMAKISLDARKAKEIVTGALPALPLSALCFIESTSEGASGVFYTQCQSALKRQESGRRLTALDFKLHFFGWWIDPLYKIYDEEIRINREDNKYFDTIELHIKRTITIEQRRWYVVNREMMELDITSHQSAQEMMFQEFPSILDECFSKSNQGTYYIDQFSYLRKYNRITNVPYDTSHPVHTFWDIGVNDQTAVVLVQIMPHCINVINHIEASGEPFNYFISWMKSLNYIYGTHYLPHDAANLRQLGNVNQSAIDILFDLAIGWDFQIVPRTPSILQGIQQTRVVFTKCYFDEVNCAQLLRQLEKYSKEWDSKRGVYKAVPATSRAFKEATNSADAFRMLGQSHANNNLDHGGYFAQQNTEPENVPEY